MRAVVIVVLLVLVAVEWSLALQVCEETPMGNEEILATFGDLYQVSSEKTISARLSV